MEYKRTNGYKDIDKKNMNDIQKFCEDYKKFLNAAKTEREAVNEFEKMAIANGYKNAEDMSMIKPGDKVYYNNRGKNIVLFIAGKEDIEKGVNFVVSHIDSPRLDLKQSPLYEDEELALLKTHYYGGIKKYQWGSIPLALHGVVFLKDGKKVELTIGESDEDPIFVIGDLLPHLASKVQGERKTREVLKGEELRLIIGSVPTKTKDDKNGVKMAVLEKLNAEYGIEEEDFLTAELEIVPSFKARDVGFDRGLVASYGQDDRVCAYTSVRAIFDVKKAPKKTLCVFLTDKEEIGSNGSTGLQGQFIEYCMTDFIYKLNGGFNQVAMSRCMWNSKALSSDVDAAVHPVFKEVHDLQNAARLSYGLTLVKFTGSGGKSGSNDCDSEYFSELRRLFNKHDIKWQVSELGKVDEGGGGTIAKYLAQRGVRTIDAGVGVIGMHSPFEITSKYDVYEAYKAYVVFLENA